MLCAAVSPVDVAGSTPQPALGRRASDGDAASSKAVAAKARSLFNVIVDSYISYLLIFFTSADIKPNV